jgi:hypothetical protein
MRTSRSTTFTLGALSTLLACAATNLGGSDGATGGTGGSGGSGATSGGSTGTPPDPETALDEAKDTLPTYMALHRTVIARTCTPNEGVCHNDKEYPDLHTPQAMLGAVGHACNLAVEDAIDTFDGCEVKGDRFSFMEYGPNQDWTSEIAWTEEKQSGSVTDIVVHLRDAIPNAYDGGGAGDSGKFLRDYPEGTLELTSVYERITYEAGGTAITLSDFDGMYDGQKAAISGLVLGDPNRNGIFGAEGQKFQLIAPGDPSTSYLLGRLQATVPGTPMPLANQPLSTAEMLAVACWIEGLTPDNAKDVYAAIDYDGCEFAAKFGQPDPTSGHSFSADVQPIFEARCSAAGCHGGDMPAAGLDLTSGVARDNLLRTATQDASRYRVIPGNPADSYLMLKLWGKGLQGVQMPKDPMTGAGGELDEASVAVIEAWIVAGAPDD